LKRAELVFTVLLIPVDFVMLLIASLLVYSLRFSQTIEGIRPVQFELPFGEYFALVLLMIPIWIGIFALTGLYKIKRQQRLVDDLYRVFIGVSAGMMGAIIFIFFRHELFSSRFIVIANWILATLLVTFGRFMVRRVRSYLYKYDYGVRRVVVIGDNQVCKSLVRFFHEEPHAGYRVMNHFKELDKEEFKKITNNLEKGRVDEIINGDPTLDKRKNVKLIQLADEFRIDYRYIPDFFETKATNIDVTTLAGIPIVSLRQTPLDGWGRIVKRTLDLIAAVIGIILCLPLFAVIALIVKMDSPGPVIYRNKRVGYKGKEFNTYKLRSMKLEYCTGTEYGGKKALEYEKELIQEKSTRKGPIYKVIDDPRRTKLGKFLERTSLDELPQLFNVFMGNMSLVGPRPHQPREVANYDKQHTRILTMKPGITGLAQISGRSDLDFNDEFKLDVYYMENWSFATDLQILLKTPFTLLKRRNFS